MTYAISRKNNSTLSFLLAAMALLVALLPTDARRIPAAAATHIATNLRLAFAPLTHQGDGYIARGNGFSLQLTRDAATLSLPAASGASGLQMSFADARRDVQLAGTAPLAGVAHYYLGNDPQAWRRDVALHERVSYTGLYDGIDAVFYGNGQRFEYDFIVAPGADPSVIALRFDGARSIRIDAAGDLLLETDGGTVRQLRPQLYQVTGTRHEPVDGNYVIRAPNEVRFSVGTYDASRTLVIDPVLDYGTFIGGSGGDAATRVAVDAGGNMTVVGYTFSTDLPATLSYDAPYAGGTDTRHAFVAKYKPEGSLLYIAYLGGTLDDLATDVAVDADGNAYVVGETHSPNFPDFPMDKGPTHGGDVDAFLTVLSPDGTQLKYSRMLGGKAYDVGHGVALGPNNLVYVAGETWSLDFPITVANAFDDSCGNPGDLGCGFDRNDGFLAVVDTVTNTLRYVTYLGGSGNDKTHAVAVNRKSGVAYLTGETSSTDLPMRNGFQSTLNGAFNAMVMAIDPNNSGDASLLYASYFGGSNEDYAEHIAITASGQLYLAGGTQSNDLLVKAAYQNNLRGSSDAFVVKIDPTATGQASLLYATYFGGTGDDDAAAIAVDRDDGAIFVGMTTSNDLPVSAAVQNSLRGGSDAYVAKLAASGANLNFGSYLGGSSEDAAAGVAVNANGDVYISGDSNSSNFPLAGSSAQATKPGAADVPDATLVRLTPFPGGSASSSPSGAHSGTTTKSGGGAWDALLLLAAMIALRRRRILR